MATRTVTVGCADGLHARPAALFVKAASEQPAVVMIAKGDSEPVATNSILAVMTLGVAKGDEVTLSAQGDGAQESVDALGDMLLTDF